MTPEMVMCLIVQLLIEDNRQLRRSQLAMIATVGEIVLAAGGTVEVPGRALTGSRVVLSRYEALDRDAHIFTAYREPS